MKMTSKAHFFDHVEELRFRLFKSLIAILMGAMITHYFSDLLLIELIKPSTKLNFPLTLQVLKITSMFMIKLGMAFMGGVILASPVVLYQIWKFIYPAFKDGPNNSILLIVTFSTLFFIIGLVFGYKIIIPFSLNFFTSVVSSGLDIKYNFTLEGYLTYVMWLMFTSGLIFQLPVISLMGTKVGILTPAFLKHYRKYAIIIFLIIGSLLTPPDPLSQILIFCPLVFLYEFSIIISWIFK